MEAKHDLSDNVKLLFIRMCPGLLLDKSSKDENYLSFMWWLSQLEKLSLSWLRVEGSWEPLSLKNKHSQQSSSSSSSSWLEKTEVKGEAIVYEPCGAKSWPCGAPFESPTDRISQSLLPHTLPPPALPPPSLSCSSVSLSVHNLGTS